MEEVNISETESRYYSDLFNVCDVEKKASKVPNLKATEMFRSANLENDILKQVSIFVENVHLTGGFVLIRFFFAATS